VIKSHSNICCRRNRNDSSEEERDGIVSGGWLAAGPAARKDVGKVAECERSGVQGRHCHNTPLATAHSIFEVRPFAMTKSSKIHFPVVFSPLIMAASCS
jgi:hypothetical protein